MLKIDVHTHILPERLPDFQNLPGGERFVRIEHQAPRSGASGSARMIVNGSLFREIERNSWDIETRLSECDAAGVGVQVLSTVPVMFSYWAEPGPALELARHLNDHIAGVVAAHPARFAGLGTIPMQSPDLAIRELERCVRDLGLSGVEIGSNVNGANLDNPELFPVFEAAASLGAAVFVHPWEMAGRDRMTRYWLPWLVGMPAETLARDLLAHLRRRAREAAGACGSDSRTAAALFRRRSGESPAASKRGRTSAPFPTTFRRATISGGSTSTRSCTNRGCCATSWI